LQPLSLQLPIPRVSPGAHFTVPEEWISKNIYSSTHALLFLLKRRLRKDKVMHIILQRGRWGKSVKDEWRDKTGCTNN